MQHSNDPNFTAERETIRARYTADTIAPTESAQEYGKRWGTYARPEPYAVENVRCAEHSTFDADGFATDGRCTAPVIGAPCEVCGRSC